MSFLGLDSSPTTDHQHACLLYDSRTQHLGAVASFHRGGLAAGNRCIHVLSDAPLDSVRGALRDIGVDVDAEVERGALLLLGVEDVYLRTGEFDPDAVIDYWREAADEAERKGFAGLSVSGDTSWTIGHDIGAERFAEYEAEINDLLREGRMQAICCYDRRRFPARGLAAAMRTHPRILLADGVLETDALVERSEHGVSSDKWLAPLLEHLRRSEELLREAHATKESLFEVTPAGIYTCDAEGLITSFNPGAERLWGRAPAIGDTADRFCGSFRLFLPDGSPMPHGETPMAAALRDGTSHEGVEVVIERPDGSRVTAIANIAPITDGAGRVTGAVNCLVDITDRKEAEARVRAQDRRKDEFLAMLSHELRNPLAPARTSIEILRSPESEPSDREAALGILDRQVTTLTHLVNDLLDVSRVTRGKIEIQRTTLDLGALLECVVDAVRSLFEEREQTLTVSFPDEAVWVTGDETRLEQVVVNLLSNAAKYTPKGGRAWVTITREDGDAVIRVKDTGAGIAPELKPDLFDLFAQGEQPLDRTKSGLGVGLALTKSLVEMHGGSISVHSDGPGTGSEFVIRLPAAEPAAEHEGAVMDNANDDTASSTLRVLFVEDHQDAREVAEILLQSFGYEVRTAADGVAAMEVAREFRPDVIVLDIGLPGMDGYEVARRMREDSGLKDIVLVALTGYGDLSDRQRSHEAGFDHHLVKPADFTTTVRQLLQKVEEERAR